MTTNDISEMRESLGNIVASCCYHYDALSQVRMVDNMIAFEKAMLKKLKRYNKSIDKQGTTYKIIFDDMRMKWAKSLDHWNTMGDWKTTWKITSELYDQLLSIALEEDLITLNKELFNLSSTGLGGMQPQQQQQDGESD